MTERERKPHELTTDELDHVSGGEITVTKDSMRIPPCPPVMPVAGLGAGGGNGAVKIIGILVG
jgi:bacteriocin-like protein